MDTCSACHHEDMVHFHWAGCCGVVGCPCEGTDGKQNCRRPEHGPDCWWATPIEPFIGPKRPPLTRVEADQVFALHDDGIGTRRIAFELKVKRPIVQQTIRGEWWSRSIREAA